MSHRFFRRWHLLHELSARAAGPDIVNTSSLYFLGILHTLIIRLVSQMAAEKEEEHHCELISASTNHGIRLHTPTLDNIHSITDVYE